MPSSPWFRFHRPPSGLLLMGLLCLTLVLAGVLAHQAQDAARSHRATAEGVLRDYADLAASDFAKRAENDLHGVLRATLRPVIRRKPLSPGEDLPPPAVLATASNRRCGCPRMDSVQSYFRVDLRNRELLIDGAQPSPAVRAWLVSAVTSRILRIEDPDWRTAAAFGEVDGESHGVGFTVLHDEEDVPVAAYGVLADPAAFGIAFPEIMQNQKRPLLPIALTKEASNDSLLSVRVRDPSGYEVFRSAMEYPGTFVATDTLPVSAGGLIVQAALRPDVAERLLIGGLPRSRLPLLLGLLALTAGLAGIAFLQLRRAAELARLRAGFISGISHELRTPLAQIRMFTETLLLGRVRSEEERRRSLEIIDQEARRLTHLVENVLHFSRSERSVSRLAPVATEIAPRVRDVVEAFTPLARARGVDLRLELDERLVAPLDPEAFSQILLNLLDNAVKYGPAGQTVTVGAARAGEHARLWVEDEGPGVHPKDRERIWKSFSRLERETSRGVAGSGIGLSVVRELVRLHGGHTRVEEAPEGGARFVVELPNANSRSPEAHLRSPGPTDTEVRV